MPGPDADPRFAEDATIRRELEELKGADDRRRTATPSTEEYHDAVADVERQARRIIRGVSNQEERVEDELAEATARSRGGGKKRRQRS